MQKVEDIADGEHALPDYAGGPEKWAVVNTHPHKEELALRHLANQDLEAYCPRIRKRIRHARQFREVLRPLFPGYAFVRVPSRRELWRPIMSTIGVRTLIRFGDAPALMDDAFVASLKAREEDGIIVRAAPATRPPTPYTVGETVKLNEGPFEGTIATILSVSEKDRLVILMDLLQHGVRARVSVDQVIPMRGNGLS